jgi:glycosyltransferase involved in cell wall biosynthesis
MLIPRILFITERFPPDIGGLASSSDRITQALCKLGFEVDVLTWSRYLQPGEVLPPDLAEANTPQVYRVGLYRSWDSTMPHTLNVLDWLHQSRKYAAIWGHYLFPGGFLATWFAAGNGIASTVSVRGNDIDREMFPPGDFARLQWTLANAQTITAVSADIAEKIRRLSQRDDVLILKNAVNEKIFSPSNQGNALKTALDIGDDVVLGFAGELREKKGQKFLLNALTTVRAHRSACLLIIGEIRASQAGLLQAYATQYPEARSRIIITGHLNDPAMVAQHLQLCDIYLQPSLWEGMPNALLEAMAMERCCIASDAGGIPEAISHGENGFLLPRFQLHKLGEAVLECLDLEPEMRSQIGIAARDRILAEFSLVQEQHRLQTAIDRLLPLKFT